MTTTAIRHTIETRQPTPASRVIETRYVIEEPTANDRRGDLMRAALVVRVSDYAERKAYLVTVDRQTQSGMFVRQIIDFRRNAPDYVKALSWAERRDRYSRAALVSLHRQLVTELVEPQLERLLEWAVGALDAED